MHVLAFMLCCEIKAELEVGANSTPGRVLA